MSRFGAVSLPSQGPCVAFDCIIFGLQRMGGISNYWWNLIELAAASPALSTHLLMPRQSLQGRPSSALASRPAASREKLPAALVRYLHAAVPAGTEIFHTSYYRLPRKKVAGYVVSAYDFTYERYRDGLARFVHSGQKLTSLRRADAVLCISESTRRDVLQHCPGVDPARLHVTALGVDHHAFFPETQGAGSHADTVLFVGQRAGYKRFDLAVEAVRQMPRLNLGIAGPPLSAQERDSLQGALGSRWQAFGPVDQPTLRRLYASAYAFVFPSDYEGFGLPVLEAMACGCPVVAAHRSSLPEVGGDAALYADSQQAQAYAHQLTHLEDASLRQASISRGLARAAEFTWSRTFDQTLNVYLGLAGPARAG